MNVNQHYKTEDHNLLQEFEYLMERLNTEHGMGLMVSKATVHAGLVVSMPDGDVLVTYKGNQLQNTKVKLKFWPPQQQTVREGPLVQHNYPHNNCQCPGYPCCHQEAEACPNDPSPDASEAEKSMS